MLVLPAKVRVNDDLLDSHSDLRLVQRTGAGPLNPAAAAAHDDIVRAGVPGKPSCYRTDKRRERERILLRETVGRRHDDHRLAAEEDGAAAVEGEVRLEESAVPGELVLAAHHAAQDSVESLPAAVCGVTQPARSRAAVKHL